MKAIPRPLLFALLALFLLSFTMSCKVADKDDRLNPDEKTREIARKETNLRYAMVALNEGFKQRRQRNDLGAAPYFARAIMLTSDITDFNLFPKARTVKAEAYYGYGVTIIDIWMNSGSVYIYNDEGKKVGDKISPEWAMRHIDEAIELNPGPSRYYYGRAYVYLRSGDLLNAIKWFNTAIGRDGRVADYYAFRGEANYQLALNSPTEKARGVYMHLAQKDCLRAQSLDKRNETAFVTLVKLYLLSGDAKSAKLVIQEMQDKQVPINRALKAYNEAME